MIVSVSTVKDSAANVARFCRRNLANGVDHLVVFTEDTGAEAEAVLDEHPAVTHVRTGGDWWPHRPDGLNQRQQHNANLARVLLAPFGWAEWLVHVDGDEVALLDQSVVDGLPADCETFRMPPWEAVSREAWPEGEVTHFKRLLAKRELSLLLALEVIPEPTNKAYFHGHVQGKVGVRLRTDQRLGIHHATDGGGASRAASYDGLAVLHHDSATAEEFVRKFRTLTASGSRVVYRRDKVPVLNAMRHLVTMGLDEATTDRYLRRIYERTTREDFDTLLELGLLQEVRADQGTHRPEPAPPADLAAFEALLAAAAPLPRRPLNVQHPSGGLDVLRSALDATGVPPGAAAALLDAAAGAGTGAVR
ncbi:glycosyltransferase family 2 protein [Nocardioides litoris]|uniref:glycosyltransferase family 2 protein n=1 Tax=Nocardioides litoris TaxID=1926648 RepID=UPI0014773FFA|nr:glycosyltransferase family 2 protein [Nocardioides litoris]